MNNNQQKPLLAIAIATLSALSTSHAAAEIVRIGHVAPLTGAIAHLGKDNENGARLAIKEINAQGLLIGGKKIQLELDAHDDAADPRVATQVAQKLVDDKVIAVIGHLNSGTSIPASRIYNHAGIAQISPSSTNPAYTQQGFKTTYRLVATDAQQGPALATYAKSAGIKSVAIVDDATAYGQGLADEFEKKARALGLNVLSREKTNDKAIDFRAILTKIKGERPDAIMYGGMDATGGPFVKQAERLGLHAKILAGDGVCTDKLADLAGDAVTQVVCSQAGAALEKMQYGKVFQTKYRTSFSQPVQIYAPFTYDAVYVIVDAMKRAQSTDPAKILLKLPNTNLQGVTGTITFDKKGDIKHGVISLYHYRAPSSASNKKITKQLLNQIQL